MNGSILSEKAVCNLDNHGIALLSVDGWTGGLAVDGERELLEAVGRLELVSELPPVVPDLGMDGDDGGG